jgi:flagellar motor switch protein FliM
MINMHREMLSDEELSALRTPTREIDTSTSKVAPEVDVESPCQSLKELHRALADSLSSTLSTLIHREVAIGLRDQTLGTYAQFVFSQPIPTCCAIVRAESINLETYFAIQPTIIYPLIDRLLGCKQSDPIPQRPITEIESGLAVILLTEIIGKYNDAWQQALTLDLRIARIEHNVQRLGAMPGSEPTYRARYELRCGSDFGQLEICLPWKATNQIRQRLSAGRA